MPTQIIFVTRVTKLEYILPQFQLVVKGYYGKYILAQFQLIVKEINAPYCIW